MHSSSRLSIGNPHISKCREFIFSGLDGIQAPTFNQGDILTRLRARLSVLDDRPSLQTVKIVQHIFPSPNASSCLSQETPWSKDIFRSRRTSSIGTAIRWHENGQVPLWLSRYSRRPRWGKEAKRREFNSRSAARKRSQLGSSALSSLRTIKRSTALNGARSRRGRASFKVVKSELLKIRKTLLITKKATTRTAKRTVIRRKGLKKSMSR